MFGRKRRKPPVAAAPECFFCHRQIGYGEPYVSLNYHIERTDDGRVIYVEQAESLLIGCVSCAPAPRAIVDTLRTRYPAVDTRA